MVNVVLRVDFLHLGFLMSRHQFLEQSRNLAQYLHLLEARRKRIRRMMVNIPSGVFHVLQNDLRDGTQTCS